MAIVQMPCANSGCGSDLVRDEVSLVDKRTGKRAEVRPWTFQAALLILSCVALASVQLLRSSTGRLVLDFSVVAGFAMISLASLALLAQPRIVARLIPSERLHTYTCQICGHRWQVHADARVGVATDVRVEAAPHE
ncbi:MAG: hypothetical protein ACRDHP_18765 [Ktedonobacterales bacterium]